MGTLQPLILCVETVEHELPALALPAFLTPKARKIQITDWEAVSGRDVSRVMRCLHCDSFMAGIRMLPKYTKMPCKMFFGSKDVLKYLWILHPCRRCQFPTLSKCRTFRQNAQVEAKVPKVRTEQVTSARRPKRSQRFKMHQNAQKKSDAELDSETLIRDLIQPLS